MLRGMVPAWGGAVPPGNVGGPVWLGGAGGAGSAGRRQETVIPAPLATAVQSAANLAIIAL